MTTDLSDDPDIGLLSRPTDDRVVQAFRAHIEAAPFPCAGAKASVNRDEMHYVRARDISSAWDDLRVHDAVVRFARGYDPADHDFRSLAILFGGPDDLDEEAFEHHLWARLQSWTDKDVWRGQDHDGNVSPEPGDKEFSLSFGGRAFFSVGLHPGSSRKARRFAHPVIVLNLHDQFEKLRADDRYDKLHKTIMKRDAALQGSVNPMLAHHGTSSAARQYSGRAVDPDWEAPFERREPGRPADRWSVPDAGQPR